MAGSDAVLSLVGHVQGSPPTLQTDATRSIVAAMQRLGVRRLITLSGGGLRTPEDQPRAADRVMRSLLRVLAGSMLRDAKGRLAVLESSDLDWTVVRAPRLTERPGTGVPDVGWVGGTGRLQVSRDDVADVLLARLHDRASVQRMPFVT